MDGSGSLAASIAGGTQEEMSGWPDNRRRIAWEARCADGMALVLAEARVKVLMAVRRKVYFASEDSGSDLAFGS